MPACVCQLASADAYFVKQRHYAAFGPCTVRVGEILALSSVAELAQNVELANARFYVEFWTAHPEGEEYSRMQVFMSQKSCGEATGLHDLCLERPLGFHTI